MKIAIISDTHDNLFVFEKFAKQAVELGIESVIHCGDVGSPENFRKIVATWHDACQVDLAYEFARESHSRAKVFLVLGNMDAGRGGAEAYLKAVEGNKYIKVFENIGEVEIDGIKIALGHEPKKMKPVAESGAYNFVFYGHTHRPWMEVLKNGCIFANPGNLSDQRYLSSFAILDTTSKKLELKILRKPRQPLSGAGI